MGDKVEFTDDQQKFVDDLVGTARVKAREKAQAEFKAQSEKSAAEAETAALAANKEWQKLAEASAARVKELEPIIAEASAYRDLVSGLLKSKVKELGDAAKTAVGGLPESMSPADRLDWLSKNEKLFEVETSRVGTPAGRKSQRKETDKQGSAKRRSPRARF